ncbi:MAG TPA: hypothetical protein VMA13_01660, partial [Candidatus Saccharimonadales bacterium]|nr:hypothetical protein [Candidatus Saccharimonadales bacterium]
MNFRSIVPVEQMLAARKRLAGAQSDKDKDFYTNRCDGLDRQIDTLVYDLYALAPPKSKSWKENNMANNHQSMRGQWKGKSTGTNTGTVIANFDELPSCYQGAAYLLDDNAAVPASVAFFKTTNKDSTFRFRAEIKPVDPRTGVFTEWENIKNMFG